MTTKESVIKRLAIAFCMMMIVTAFGGCLGEGKTPEKKTILRAGFAWPTYIDPAEGSDYSSSTALCNLYDPLVFPTETEIKPWVAKNWDVSSDGKVWTFYINEGIKFHSGRELTAKDVAFSMERLLTIGRGFSYIYAPYIKSSNAVDKYTVKFTLDKPFGPFLSSLVRLYIVDKEEVLSHIKTPGAYGEYGDFAMEWLLTHDAGSGPYKVKDVKLEEYVYMERFKDYWKEMVSNAPDEMRLLALASPPTERTLLMNRELEISSQWLPEEILRSVDRIEGIDVASIPAGGSLYLMMHTKKSPLDDIHVRKAISYAFDYETVVRYIFPGSPSAKGPIPSIILGWSSDVPVYYQDLAKAEEELKASKYWPGITKHPENYQIELHWCAEVPAEEKVAVVFAECMEKIGLITSVVKTPWLKMVEEMGDQETSPHIVVVYVSSHYPEAGSILESKYHSKSALSWEQNEWLLSDEIDMMIEDALSTIDQEARFAKYGEIQWKIMELCPTLMVCEQTMKFAYQTYVKWPAGEGIYIPVMGYAIDGRRIQILPH
ncbi:MAG TPA: ABC transporter substrate-binding protein [Thermoplasmata archaeon]|nr:ABC transporter substrate-binding protein [Thermoplasmata archaeon]